MTLFAGQLGAYNAGFAASTIAFSANIVRKEVRRGQYTAGYSDDGPQTHFLGPKVSEDVLLGQRRREKRATCFDYKVAVVLIRLS